MSKVITDPKLIDEVLTRGVENIYPNKEAFRKLLASGKRIRLYCGYDPSASALHIGNAISINKMSQLQALGHEVIFLIGDFTGMIGDPTDKTATRKKLTREEVLKNSKNYRKQASGYLKFDGDNPAQVMYNSKWNDVLSFKDLIELSSNFTVQQMIVRDMFQKRIKEEKPVFLHEFLYPLAQGYDSVAMDVDLEIGGNDQMFNMMTGRDLMRSLKNKEKYVMTLKLLADDKGNKMGKSEGNAVFLDQEPEDMYGKVMSWADEILGVAFELCTKLPMVEVKSIQQELKSGNVNPRDYKMKLAYEIVKINHGEDGAKRAVEHFKQVFQKKELPDDIPEFSVGSDEINIITLMCSVDFVSTTSDARRLIKQGAVKFDDKKVDSNEVAVPADGRVLRVGKRRFVRVVR